MLSVATVSALNGLRIMSGGLCRVQKHTRTPSGHMAVANIRDPPPLILGEKRRMTEVRKASWVSKINLLSSKSGSATARYGINNAGKQMMQ